ncbi:RNA-directed DNA polymerase, eukaryota, partial [Tanacetum coccineum]
STRFWKDRWIDDHSLIGKFPRLYALETNKDISVADKLHPSLSFSWRRSVRGGIESQKFNHLSSLLDSVSLSNSEDRWVCDLSGDGAFRVKDVKNILDEFFLSKSNVPTRWVKFIPNKVNIFAWKLFLNRLPTRSNLAKRKVSIDTDVCPVCDSTQEEVAHIFFCCSLARDLTRLICRWWNLDEHLFSSYAEWLSWFNSLRLGSKLKAILEGVFYITWWSVWNFRNHLLFASTKLRKESIFDDIVLRSFSWCVAREASIYKKTNMVFSEKQEELVKQSWELMKEDIAVLSLYFFTQILEIAPAAKGLFSFLKDADEIPENNPKLKAHAIKVFKMTCEAAIQLREKGEVVVSGSTLKYLGSVHLQKGVVAPQFEVLY